MKNPINYWYQKYLAEKAKNEQMQKDAIETTVKVDAGGYPYVDIMIELYDYDNDVPLARAGDKVKFLIFKNN